MAELKERGFEDFGDIRIEEIGIDTISKTNDQYRFDWTNPKTVEMINGHLLAEAPLFGNEKQKMYWHAFVETWNPDLPKNWKAMFPDGNFNMEIIWDSQPEGSGYNSRTGGMPMEVREAARKSGLLSSNGEHEDFWNFYHEMTKKAHHQIEEYIKKNALPELAAQRNLQDSTFNIRAEISTKTEEQLQEELADSLEKGVVDEKFLYIMDGTEKFLEIVNDENYEITNLEKKLKEKHLEEISSEIGDEFIDLGCGDGLKAMPIMEEMKKGGKTIKYRPNDISPRMIFEAASNAPKDIRVEGELFDFTKNFKNKVSPKKKTTVGLLGGTIGNGDMEYQENLMKNIAESIKTGDNFVVGIHLNYDFQEILKKYQTPELMSIAGPMLKNLELEGTAEIFTTGDENKREIYVNIRILDDKIIKIGKHSIFLPVGKTVRLIVSHKYEIPEMEHLAQVSGLKIKRSFLNEENSYGLFVLEK